MFIMMYLFPRLRSDFVYKIEEIHKCNIPCSLICGGKMALVVSQQDRYLLCFRDYIELS